MITDEHGVCAGGILRPPLVPVGDVKEVEAGCHSLSSGKALTTRFSQAVVLVVFLL